MTLDQGGHTTSAPDVTSVVWWKRLAIACLFGGAGFALALATIIGLVGWYHSRPKPPRPWNTNALIASGPPGFSVVGDGKSIELSYSLQNTTSIDYKVDSDSQINLLVKTADGTLSPPLSKESASVALPVFVPAGQKARLILSLVSSDIPQRSGGETDEGYHERVRAYLNKAADFTSFAIFEEAKRYQINLPRWLSKPPPQVK
jgi:hypothetical protein